jgi:hypothetical protein
MAQTIYAHMKKERKTERKKEKKKGTPAIFEIEKE